MPRICREAANDLTPEQRAIWTEWLRRGDGTSNFDVCNKCAKNLPDNAPWPESLKPRHREPKEVPAVVNTGVEHPCYSEMRFDCDLCGRLLKEKDN